MNVAADLIVHPSDAGVARKHVAKPNTEEQAILIETIGAEDGKMERARDECGSEYGLHLVEIFAAVTFNGDVHQWFLCRSGARAEDFPKIQKRTRTIAVRLTGIGISSSKAFGVTCFCSIE